jgi:transcriptional regulator of acetoin/glycerol metabolism
MSPSASGFPSPIGRLILDSIGEGVAVFDREGELHYANTAARKVFATLGNGDVRAEQVRQHATEIGARVVPLKVDGNDVGDAVFIPPLDGGVTLADQERRAILDTLQSTHGKLAEAARRLGISRTTLWRRLKSYGVDRQQHRVR